MEIDYRLIVDAITREGLERDIEKFFPNASFSMDQFFELLFKGDLMQACKYVLGAFLGSITNPIVSVKNVFVYLLIVGIVTAMTCYINEIFQDNPLKSLTFYYSYLAVGIVLIKGFSIMFDTTKEVLNNVILFIKMMVPTLLFSVSISNGVASAFAGSQLEALLLYLLERIQQGIVLPIISAIFIFIFVSGICSEEKLDMFIDFLSNIVSQILKGTFILITGLGIFQSTIVPYSDKISRSGLKKLVSLIPGIGDVTEAVTDILFSTATLVKNGLGLFVLILAIILCVKQLLNIAVYVLVFKLSAAFLSIIADKRIAVCVNRVGDLGLLLLKVCATAIIMFFALIVLAGASFSV